MIFKPELIEKILTGEKTVTRRPGSSKYRVGQIVAVQPGMARQSVARIKVLRVEDAILRKLWVTEAQREGFDSFADFKAYWIRLYGQWTPGLPLKRIEFELVEKLADVCKCCGGTGFRPVRVAE